MRPTLGTARVAFRKAMLLRDLARRELKSDGYGYSLAERARWVSRGFLSESALYYGLDEENWRPYVTDFERSLRTPFINGIYNPVLNDKLVFYHTMVSLGAPTPTVYGLVGEQVIAWVHAPREVEAEGIRGLLERVPEVVLKPVNGGLGDRISFVTSQEGVPFVNGEPSTDDRVRELLSPGTLICERIHQGSYASGVFEGAINTLRVITMWDYAARAPFVAVAEHRFGTRRSAPVDNTAKGGLFAGVDVRTGTLTKSLQITDGQLEWSSRHAETGAQIEGLAIPGWDEMCAGLLRLAARLAHIPYIGWDVVMHDEGYSIIEGNTYPDAQTQAVSGPFLADPRVQAFYEHHRVLRRDIGSARSALEPIGGDAPPFTANVLEPEALAGPRPTNDGTPRSLAL
jgi:hypothetical protein